MIEDRRPASVRIAPNCSKPCKRYQVPVPRKWDKVRPLELGGLPDTGRPHPLKRKQRGSCGAKALLGEKSKKALKTEVDRFSAAVRAA